MYGAHLWIVRSEILYGALLLTMLTLLASCYLVSPKVTKSLWGAVCAVTNCCTPELLWIALAPANWKMWQVHTSASLERIYEFSLCDMFRYICVIVFEMVFAYLCCISFDCFPVFHYPLEPRLMSADCLGTGTGRPPMILPCCLLGPLSS